MTAVAGCTCARLRGAHGREVGAAWLTLHDQGARLELVDGQVLDGWATDVQEEAGASFDGSHVVIALWPEVGEMEYVDAREVRSATPLRDQTSADRLLAEVTALVAIAPALTDGHEEELSLVVDEHSKLEIVIRKRSTSCLPRRPQAVQRHAQEDANGNVR